MKVSSQSEIFDQIAAHTRADNRTLNAMSVDGYSGVFIVELFVDNGAETFLNI